MLLYDGAEFKNVDHALFQARVWRNYAMEWDLPESHVKKQWVRKILRMPREECLRKSRRAVNAARILNQMKKEQIP